MEGIRISIIRISSIVRIQSYTYENIWGGPKDPEKIRFSIGVTRFTGYPLFRDFPRLTTKKLPIIIPFLKKIYPVHPYRKITMTESSGSLSILLIWPDFIRKKVVITI